MYSPKSKEAKKPRIWPNCKIDLAEMYNVSVQAGCESFWSEFKLRFLTAGQLLISRAIILSTDPH